MPLDLYQYSTVSKNLQDAVPLEKGGSGSDLRPAPDFFRAPALHCMRGRRRHAGARRIFTPTEKRRAGTADASLCLLLCPVLRCAESGLVDGTEQLHLLLDGRLDRLEARCEELSRVKALALEILAGLDVLSGRLSKGELALGVDVDLGNAEGNRLLDHVGRDARTAVENERHRAGELLNLREHVEVEALPVGRILAVDVADAGCEHVDAEICDHLALFRIRDFAAADDAVFLAADRADFRLNGDALLARNADEFLRLRDVLLDRIVWSRRT